jgi:putative transposase
METYNPSIMKAGVYTQMYVQLVFAVKNRRAVLIPEIRNQVFEYMSGILSSLRHKSIIVNGVSSHVHILMGLNPTVSISGTVHDLKRGSSLYINDHGLLSDRFTWQEGFGGFTYSRSQLDDVYKYIQNQQKHHERVTFKEEYIQFLNKFEIEFEERFLFDFLEEESD